MLAYAARRLATGVVLLVLASFVVFLLTSSAGDPLAYLKGRNPPPPPDVIRTEAERLHLDEPLVSRYVTWLGGVVRGDFGPSVHHNVDIGAELLTRTTVTMRLIVVAMLLALLLSVVVGVVGAVKQYSVTDHTATFLGFLFLAMPSFWLALLLKQLGIQLNAATGTQVVYTIGEASAFPPDGTWARLADAAGHLVLPTIALALICFASWSRYCRASMLEALHSDYVRFARAKGLSPLRVMVVHALRTALVPLTTVTALDLATVISGAVVTETVFQWRGLGDFLVQSLRTFDVYAVLGWLLVSATVVVLFNLLADLLYGVLDPRVRHD